MIALLFLFSLAHASSSGGSSNAVTSTTTTPPPLVHQSACDFLAPLANYTAVGVKVESNRNYNLPLANPSGKRVNLTNIGGNSVSYALLGTEHLFNLQEMDEKELESACDCLSKLSKNEPRGTIIQKEAHKVCLNKYCANFTADFLVKNRLLAQVKAQKLIDLELETLLKLVELGVLSPEEYNYLKRVKEGVENRDEQKLSTLREDVFIQLEEEVELAEAIGGATCDLLKEHGRLFEYTEKKAF